MIVDVGAGDGRFARPLASELRGRVIAVEPSTRMREAGLRQAGSDLVECRDGVAESLPLATDSVEGTLLSNVLQYVPELAPVVSECVRVLNRVGSGLVRGFVRERLHDLPHRFFPDALALAAEGTPTAGEITSGLAAGGFRIATREQVSTQVAPNLAACREPIALRTISCLQRLEDRAFAAGPESMRIAAVQGQRPHGAAHRPIRIQELRSPK